MASFDADGASERGPSSPTVPGAGLAHDTGDPDRFVAAFEVFLCSGIPTQLVIGQTLALAGYSPFANGEPQAGALFTLALLDSAILVTLILLLMRAHGERPLDIFIGSRSIGREAGLGLLLVPALFVGVGLTMLLVRATMPWLHNIPSNPFERLIQTPGDAMAFALVAIVAGGLREEIQRAFLLRRFELHLGGSTVGLIVVSAAFGAGHFVQGWDAAIATSLLGLTWGMLYLRRRSIVAPVVSHSGYNALQIVQVLTVRALGSQ